MTLQNKFDEILDSLGNNAANFFMAASLYHAKKISFATAASLANLTFDAFLVRLEEHFGRGFIIDDATVLEDIATVDAMFSTSL